MCGIIGVTGVPDAARVAYLGLYSLQHRGQESAGIVAVDAEGVARSHRGMGLVSDIFTERVLGDLGAGDVAIGHTRYSTAGSSVLANAQDRKSTRLNSSHSSISYAVFCLKKKRIRRTFPVSFDCIPQSLPRPR